MTIKCCNLCVFEWNERDGDRFLNKNHIFVEKMQPFMTHNVYIVEFYYLKIFISPYSLSRSISSFGCWFCRLQKIWHFDYKANAEQFVNVIYYHIRTLGKIYRAQARIIKCNVHFAFAPIKSNSMRMRSFKLLFGWCQNLIIFIL